MRLTHDQVNQIARPIFALVVVGAIGTAMTVAAKPLPKVADTVVQNSSNTSDSTEVSATPVPTGHVTVNGQDVPLDTTGSASVTAPTGGNTQVEVSNNGRTVTTTTVGSKPGAAVSSNSGNVNLSVNSSSNGGSSWGTTQVFGSSFSNSTNGTTNGFSTTNVFSSDSTNNVNVTP